MSDYSSWELSYYRHLINLRNIIINYFPKEKHTYLLSSQFFSIFTRFVYENSSKRIDLGLEPLSTKKELYLKIKD